ncbi:MAG TPA: GNAT family N-acetyltransferase [Candidatus Acidoferrum sp.]|nr:GNAT family N-acetyltransferase [Candidatus Acidoferrum sp.]
MIRTAVLADVDAIEGLIAASVHGLQAGDYSQEQREGALGTVFGADRQMIADGTYYIVEEEGRMVACGGWSRRRTPFGGDRSPRKDDSFLDPATDAARIRAFFVHPDFARRGLGTLLLNTCEDAARAAGFTRAELTSTLTGIPLYDVRGFVAGERLELPLGNGATLPVVRMEKSLA